MTPPPVRPSFVALEAGSTRGGVGGPPGGDVGDSVLLPPVQMGGIVPQGHT